MNGSSLPNTSAAFQPNTRSAAAFQTVILWLRVSATICTPTLTMMTQFPAAISQFVFG